VDAKTQIYYTLPHHMFGGMKIHILFEIGQQTFLRGLSVESECLSHSAMDSSIVVEDGGNGSRQMPGRDLARTMPEFLDVFQPQAQGIWP
jgi:hypothetical protein